MKSRDPGRRATIRLGPAAEVGLWVMHAPLARVTKVDFEARTADGALLFTLADFLSTTIAVRWCWPARFTTAPCQPPGGGTALLGLARALGA